MFYRFVCFLLFFNLFQPRMFSDPAPKKTLFAKRIFEAIKIDGNLDEQVWQSAMIASDFLQLEPAPGAPSTQSTEVKVLYDNTAIYVGAKLFQNPRDISKQLFERDNMGNEIETDWFAVAFDTYMDGINGLAFIVSPSNIQSDVKFSAHDDDDSWDAVWFSQATIEDDGWIVEMKIPYAALRFPDKNEQRWHLQFARKIFKIQEESFWNEIRPEESGFFTQAGILEGISDIKSPLRLSATPFLAIYGENHFDKSADPKSTWGRSFNGGMDVKYGISDAFTLDMTLIPDFGQVRSDNEILNLSPFEVQFDENRQFFTEGTELFNKGDLFYSRRVGGKPFHYGDVEDQLLEGESIKSNPSESQLYNATKISGRSPKGTGLGFFNAIAGREYAEIEDEFGNTREFQTNPLTNYSMLVVDQNLKNNSYITFLNTNVLRSGADYDANVSGSQFLIRTRDNKYSFFGNGALSQKYYTDNTDLGFKYSFEAGKRSGKINWELGYNVDSDTYDPNDLGFTRRNNEKEWRGFISYNQYEPFGNWLRMGGGVFARLNHLYAYPSETIPKVRDNLYSSFGLRMWWRGTTKNFLRYGVFTYFQPVSSFDYFEPRVKGRFYEEPSFYYFGFDFGTDNRKKLNLDLDISHYFVTQTGSKEWSFEINPSLRLSDKLSLSYGLELENGTNNVGYVTDLSDDEIIFGIRNVTDVENLMQTNYAFNSKMTFSFRLRHNWTRVKYKKFHLLDDYGRLAETDYQENEDINFNAFTIDAVYRWRFTQGSDIFIVWKNAIMGHENTAQYDFWENLDGLLNNPQTNSISLKVIYYLDYLNLKKNHW